MMDWRYPWKRKSSRDITGALLALSRISGAAAFAENQGTDGPTAEAQACLPSPTSLSQAIAAAEAAAVGTVSAIEYHSGENGVTDRIMVGLAIAFSTAKTVANNLADGNMMNVTLAENDLLCTDPTIANTDGDRQNDLADADPAFMIILGTLPVRLPLS